MRIKFLFNRKKRSLNENGEAPIDIQISLNGERLRRQLPVWVKPREWDKRNRRVKGRTDSIKLNLILSSAEEKARSYYFNQLAAGETPSLEEIIDQVVEKKKPESPGPEGEGNKEEIETFNDYFNKMLKENTLQLASNSIKQHKVLKGYLDKYDKKIAFSDLNYKWLKSFDRWLLRQDLKHRPGKVSRNYASSLFAILKGYIKEALKEELINRDPFIGFKIRFEDKPIIFLNSKELARIEELDPSLASMAGSQKRFLFCANTGLRWDDTVDLAVEHFLETDEGLRLFKEPGKTKKHANIINLPLFSLFDGKPEKIARELMRGKKPHDLVFEPVNYSTFLDHVKRMGRMAGITKKLGTHTARHSFAMILLNEYRLPLEAVQELLGHGSIATTQVYARYITASLDEIVKEKFS